MSILTYNGVSLELIKLHEYRREAVYSGADYLYTKHTLAVRGVLNPGLTSYDYAGRPAIRIGAGNTLGLPQRPPAPPNALAPPIGPLTSFPAGAGVPGSVTDTAIRHALMQPRQRLQYSVGGVNILVSPIPGYATDAANGPRPISCNVVEIQGARTFLVDLAIECCVNECGLQKSQPASIISQQWTMTHDLDEHFYCTRTIQGRVIFRGDELRFRRLNPDDFRRQIVHPVPLNMKREGIQVVADEDGLTVHYRVVDREYGVNYFQGGQGITRVQATHTVSKEQALGKYAGYLAIVTGVIQDRWGDAGNEIFNNIPWIGHAIAGLVKEGAAGLGDLIRAIRSYTIVSHHRVVVKVWGDKTAKRNNLEFFARRLVLTRLNNLNLQGVGTFLVGSTVSHDLAGTAIELSEEYITGPVDFTDVPGKVGGKPIFPADNASGGLLTIGNGIFQGPNDDGVSRGTYLEIAVAQALQSPCGGTSVPPIPPKRDSGGFIPR